MAEWILRAHPPLAAQKLVWKGSHLQELEVESEGRYDASYGPILSRMPPLEERQAIEWLRKETDQSFAVAKAAWGQLKGQGFTELVRGTFNWRGVRYRDSDDD